MKQKKCKFEIDTETRSITFTNPFRTKTRKNNPAYADHVRIIPEEANIFEAADQLAYGVYVKMNISHDAERQKAKKKPVESKE